MNKKRKDVSVTEKFQLIDTYDKSTKKSKREVADKLGIPQSTLSILLKSHDMLNINIGENRKRKCEEQCHALDEVLLVWFKKASSYTIHL